MSYSIEIDSLSYKPMVREKGVLIDVSFTVNEGEFVSIIGRNGHGKTSIIRAIAGELKREDTSGVVRVAGFDVIGPIHKQANGVGIVHQFVQDDLIDVLSIKKNIQIRQYFSVSRKIRKNAVECDWVAYATQLISKFIKNKAITSDLTNLVGKLSGGQRQILNVLIALKLEHESDCELLLLDEHLTSLDIVIQRDVMSLINKFIYNQDQNKRKTTVVMVTHNIEYALEFSDKIIIVKNGSVNKNDIIQKNDLQKWNKEYFANSMSE